MIRAFVAIPLPEDVAETLGATCRGLAFGRPVDPGNMHLTLRFLGDCDTEVIEDIDRGLAAIRSGPIDIAFSGPGSFGGGAPRILYWGVHPGPALLDLQRAVRSAARRSGVALGAERYVPHITLLRCAGAKKDAIGAAEWLTRSSRLRPQGFCAYGFSLFSSRLHADGARYTELAHYPMTQRLPG